MKFCPRLALGISLVLLAGLPAQADASTELEATWKLPAIPVTVAWGSESGFSVSVDGEVRSPWGTFTYGASQKLPQRKSLSGVMLHIVDGDKEVVYDLGVRDVDLRVPGSLRLITSNAGKSIYVYKLSDETVVRKRFGLIGASAAESAVVSTFGIAFTRENLAYLGTLEMRGIEGSLSLRFVNPILDELVRVDEKISMTVQGNAIVLKGREPKLSGAVAGIVSYDPDTFILYRLDNGDWRGVVLGPNGQVFPLVLNSYWRVPRWSWALLPCEQEDRAVLMIHVFKDEFCEFVVLGCSHEKIVEVDA